MKLRGLKMKIDKINAINKFMFWGGNPSLLVSRSIFEKYATDKDRKAICKLTDVEFNSLEWEPQERLKLRPVYSLSRVHSYNLRIPQ